MAFFRAWWIALILSLPTVAAQAQTEIKPRFYIAFDTSGSMTVDLNNVPSFGDGVAGPTRGLDTNCDGVANDSRMFVAKEALRNMILAFGDIEYALGRFPQYTQADVTCSYDRPGSANGLQINGNECDTARGPFVGSMGDPTLNTGARVTTGNCGGEWNGLPGTETPFDIYPAACRPANPRLWATGSPEFCINYLGGCNGTSIPGIYRFPNGDVLVGFNGFGWPNTVDNRVGILKWIDNRESAFNNSTTAGNFCNHAGAGDCELRPQGPTPLGGLLRSASDYMVPIRAGDAVSCRPYTVLLLTDGFEVCNTNPTSPDHPVNVARTLFRDNDIRVYVVGLSVAPGGRGQLNDIATAGGTDAGAPGGDTAFFADDPVTLSDGLADIVADSLLIEVCNDVDDDCDTLIDEGFVKYCNRPAGVTARVLCDPPPETICDGIDDNCNGEVDEGLLNRCGACGAEPPEVCDGLDNDCDLFVDEGGVCDACRPESEICDDRDNDCDGMIDEMLMRPCGITLGECRAGSQTCVRGVWGACDDTGPSDEICDGLDNDCDGIADDLTRPCGTDVGECSPGRERCIGDDAWSECEGDVGPRDEICDGLDNDCDGETDEEIDGLGVPCGVSRGLCEPGLTACVDGMEVCDGGTGPVAEVCDGLDNDCDDLVDEGLDVGAPCGSDIGECSPGVTRCVDGEPSCEDEIGPREEECDELDNDCDAMVDEGLGLGEACGTDEGLCEAGALMCVDGRNVCIGEVPPGRETCDCEDNDCDGSIDEGADAGGLCPEGAACVECQCALPCLVSEFGFTCPTGKSPREIDGMCFCVAEACDPDLCRGETIERDGTTLCAPDDPTVTDCVCRNNECTFSCDGVVCADGLVCNARDPRGRCVEDSCRGLGCGPGEICDPVSGECDADPCLATDCAPEQACRLGVCEPSCATTECADGQSCERGVCVDDACAGAECPGGRACDPATGECVVDACGDVRCPTGSVCDPLTGACEVDECLVLHCPAGQICVDGECALDVPPVTPDAGGVDAGTHQRVLATGRGGLVCTVQPGADGGGGAPLTLLLGLLGLLLWRRRGGRRRPRPFPGVLPLLALALTATAVGGCDVDPFCIDCVDGGGAPPADAGRDATGGRRDAGPGDAGPGDAGPGDASCMEGAPERCNGFDDDCDGFVDEGVDTRSDPLNCGACGRECAPAHAFPACAEGVCGLGPCDVGWHDLDGDPDNGCEYRCLESAEDDTLCDRRDNDCDGTVDEDVDLDTDPDNCGACGSRCRFAHAAATCVDGDCVRGACDDGFFDVDGVEGTGCEYSCRPAVPPTETCNSRDDDCDGDVDEGNPGGGAACGETTGACEAGALTCVRGSLVCRGGVLPRDETCNTLDDDCDGDVDETTRFDIDPRNCGGCGVTCSAPGAITRCLAGECTIVGCEPGFHDVDPAIPGCEYMCDDSGGEVCNGLDDDCDGDVDNDLTPPPGLCLSVGVCAGTRATCRGAAGWVCDYTDPRFQEVETLCDGVDNDCDGPADEVFPLLGATCEMGRGICRGTGSYVCTDDMLGVRCNATTGMPPGTETCDGRDEDCDGLIDEDIPPSRVSTVEMLAPGGVVVNVFQYEASRPRATSTDPGTLSTAACSVGNVRPWTTVTWAEANRACCALNDDNACPAGPTSDGWRLCDVDDWMMACEGPAGTCDWSYNTMCTTSQPTRCNGAEFDCDGASPGFQNCITTTGSAPFSGCRTSWAGAGAVHDLSGNVKEWTATEVAPNVHTILGGSYNNLEDGRTCTFDFTVGDEEFRFPNTGFRCCHYDFP